MFLRVIAGNLLELPTSGENMLMLGWEWSQVQRP